MNGRPYLEPSAIGAVMKDSRAYAPRASRDDSPRQMIWIVASIAFVPWAVLAITVFAK